MSNVFRFKQFEVKQEDSAMKVGTDGVLLGAWAGVIGYESRVLDIGTGTGLIALMMAQRCVKAMVDAVEIEPLAAAEAMGNVERSPFCDRVNVWKGSFQDFSKLKSDEVVKYDLIVSNPPYFNGTYKSVQAERTAARHADLLNSDDLIAGVLNVIERSEGRFAAVFPYEVGAVFVAKAAVAGLYCNRIMNVYPKRGRGVKRILAEFGMVKRSLEQQELIIEESLEDGVVVYSEQYKSLTRDFYLKF